MLIDLRSAPDAARDRCGCLHRRRRRRRASAGPAACRAQASPSASLESGGLDFEQATQDLYRGANLGMPYYELDQSRLRFFGGTVAIWGGRCALLDPIDFEHRDWVPHSGWPIGRADLDPYYRAGARRISRSASSTTSTRSGTTLGRSDPGLRPGRARRQAVALRRGHASASRPRRAQGPVRRAQPDRPAPCQRVISQASRQCRLRSRMSRCGRSTEPARPVRAAPLCPGLRRDREFAVAARVERCRAERHRQPPRIRSAAISWSIPPAGSARIETARAL